MRVRRTVRTNDSKPCGLSRPYVLVDELLAGRRPSVDAHIDRHRAAPDLVEHST
jgi:hypothetical protein